MHKRYEQHRRFNAAGLATASILALIVAMAMSLVFDIQPDEASNGARVAHMTQSPRV